MWSCGHGLSEGNLVYQVVPIYPHEVLCNVIELLHGGLHVDLLVTAILLHLLWIGDLVA